MAEHYVIELVGLNYKEPKYFTNVKAVAEYLQITPGSVYHYLNTGVANNCGYKFRTVFGKKAKITRISAIYNFLYWETTGWRKSIRSWMKRTTFI